MDNKSKIVFYEYPEVKIYGDFSSLRIFDIDVKFALDYATKSKNEEFSELGIICDLDRISSIIIFSEDFLEDNNRIHFRPISINRNALPNGTAIPPIFQRDDYVQNINTEERIVIIINKQKLVRQDGSFVTSVIAHEFSHALDFIFLFPYMKNKYEFDVLADMGKNNKGDYTVGLYMAYSEMHAKYVQELCRTFYKYKDSKNIIKNYDSIIFYPPKSRKIAIDPLLEGQEEYWVRHLVGKFRAWEYLFSGDEKILSIITKFKNYYFTDNMYGEQIVQMYDWFDLKKLIQQCDELNTE